MRGNFLPLQAGTLLAEVGQEARRSLFSQVVESFALVAAVLSLSDQTS